MLTLVTKYLCFHDARRITQGASQLAEIKADSTHVKLHARAPITTGDPESKFNASCFSLSCLVFLHLLFLDLLFLQ